MVCIQLLLTYPEDYTLYIKSICNKYMLYDIIILEPSIFFYISHDCMTVTITLTLTLSSQ